MLGKIARALIRNEAATYRAQGLQEEALALFRQALASSTGLPADVRTSIEQEMQQIEAEMAGAALDEVQQLSEEQIAVIRKGWSENATVDELVVCANSLHALGRYDDALLELSKSVQKGYSPHRVIGALADCLVHLHEPQHLLGVIVGLTADMARSNKERYNITLALAEQMWKTGNGEHAAAIARRLAEYKGVPRDYRTRLDALLKSIKSDKTLRTPTPDPDSRTSVARSPSGSIFERIRKALSSFTASR